MQSDLDELTRVVGTMPRDLVCEALAFARFLNRKHAQAVGPTDWEDDDDNRLRIDAWDADGAPDTGSVRDMA